MQENTPKGMPTSLKMWIGLCMVSNGVLLDSCFLVAFFNKDDSLHKDALMARQLSLDVLSFDEHFKKLGKKYGFKVLP